MNYNDKKVLVTGSASGLGRELAYLFAKDNARLYLLDRDEKGLKETADNLKSNFVDSVVIDLKYQDQFDNNFPDFLKKHNGFDVVVNCAGYEVDGWVDDTPIEKFRENMEVNLFSIIKICQQVIPFMKENKMGQIINISSDMSKRSVPGRTSYCMTKSALTALTDSMRLETEPYNIDSIIVYPSVMNSNFVINSVEKYGRIKIDYEDIRAKRTPAQVAAYIYPRLKKRKKIISLFTLVKIFILLNLWFPYIADFVIKKSFNLKKSNI